MADPYLVKWADVAQADLDEIEAYIAGQDGPDRAEKIVRRILEKASALTAHPFRGKVVPELREVGILDFREIPLPPHRVMYRVRGTAVGIVGVLDGRRDLETLILARALLDK